MVLMLLLFGVQRLVKPKLGSALLVSVPLVLGLTGCSFVFKVRSMIRTRRRARVAAATLPFPTIIARLLSDWWVEVGVFPLY